jgi:hypothetical protein
VTNDGKAASSEETKSGSESGEISVANRIDVVFSGPLLLVPAVSDGHITGIEVFSPRNAHPMGAVFLPGVIFTEKELNNPSERWPDPAAFSLLDPHSYAIHITQEPAADPNPGLPVTSIPDHNHKVRPGRRLSADWAVAITVNGRISSWESHRLADNAPGMYGGSDAPTVAQTSTLHRLTYAGVTAAEFCGLSKKPKEYLQAHAGKGGTLIVLGEIPYQASLKHEREAVDSLARLAGLDLHLLITEPTPHEARLMLHVTNCGLSIIVV